MRKYLSIVFFVFAFNSFGQIANQTYQIDTYFGKIIPHNKQMRHLTAGNTSGLSLSWYVPPKGDKPYHKNFNYPDTGYALYITDFGNEFAGKNISLTTFRNFTFGNIISDHKLIFRIGIGIGYNTKPFDLESNLKNNALGSHFSIATEFNLVYKRENLIKNLGFEVGINALHVSNGAVTTPNAGVNLINFKVGLNYKFNPVTPIIPNIYSDQKVPKIKERIRLNLFAVGGFNGHFRYGEESFPFYSLGLYLDKRLSNKHIVQLGVEFLDYKIEQENMIWRNAQYATPVYDIEQYRRYGAFLGYALRMDKLEVYMQGAMYIKPKYDNIGTSYLRVGLKRYLNEKFFLNISIRTHGFQARGLEFGVGYRI